MLIAFVLLVQLAFTGIGQEIGPHWSDPAELSSAPSTAEYVAVDAAGTDDGGVAAWIVAEAGTYRVRVADVRGDAGDLTVGEPRTLATSDTPLASVDLAVRGDRLAVVWERTETNEAVLATDGAQRVVSGNESLRVNNPRVALVEGAPLVAYQEYDGEANRWQGVVARVSGETVARERFGQGMGPEAISPSIAAIEDGAVVAWVDTEAAMARTVPVSVGDGSVSVGEPVTVGQSRTVRTMSGTGQLAKVELASAGSTTTLLWTDLGSVSVTRLGADGAPLGEPTDLGRAQNPSVGTDADGQWLVTSLRTDRTSGTDVQYVLARDGALETGPVSKLPSNAVKTSSTFAPGPTAVWTESGGETRLLASSYRPDASSTALGRLQASPMRFVFLGLTAVVLGAVMVPMMPWVVAPLLVGFFATTRLALGLLSGVVGRVAGLVGRAPADGEVRRGVQGLPTLVPVGCFVAANLAVLYLLLGGSGDAIAGIRFSNPIAVSLVSAVAAGVVAWLLEFESPWKLAGLFGYVQTVGLWATAVPSFL